MGEGTVFPEAYTYIEAWGRVLGSQPYYIRAAQEVAAQDHAHADALYRREDGGWECRSHLIGRNPDLMSRLDKLAARKGGG